MLNTWKIENIENRDKDRQHQYIFSDATPFKKRFVGKTRRKISFLLNAPTSKDDIQLRSLEHPPKQANNWKAGDRDPTNHLQPSSTNVKGLRALDVNETINPSTTNHHPVRTHVKNRTYKKRRTWHRQHQHICSDVTPSKEHAVGKTRRKIPFF